MISDRFAKPLPKVRNFTDSTSIWQTKVTFVMWPYTHLTLYYIPTNLCKVALSWSQLSFLKFTYIQSRGDHLKMPYDAGVLCMFDMHSRCLGIAQARTRMPLISQARTRLQCVYILYLSIKQSWLSTLYYHQFTPGPDYYHIFLYNVSFPQVLLCSCH